MLQTEAAWNAFCSGEELTAEEMYLIGRAEAEKNQKQGMLWIWDAAEHGHIQAKYEIGEYYLLTGRRGSQMVKDGIEYIRSAAENGYVQAQYKLGSLYAIGLVVRKDPEEARKWYTLAAENGSQTAAMNLKRLDRNYHRGGIRR